MTTKRSSINLADHPRSTRQDLTAAWTHAFGSPPPKGLSSRLISYAIAYNEQTKAHGSLPPSVRRKLKAVNSKLENDSRADTPSKTQKVASEGTRLIRQWHGRTYTVEALETGFLHEGKTYRSLSEIARSITGVRWSGRRFFGVQ